MLGMYVHQHWSYNHPYAARTWTDGDWQGYLNALGLLGYDTVMIWTMPETMPAKHTPSDVAYLQKIGRVIDFAHDVGMRVLLTSTPNIMAAPAAADYTFEGRPFWGVIEYVNPRDGAMTAEWTRRLEAHLRPLAKADGLSVIDSDPGGWIDSTAEDFVSLFRNQAEIFRKLNPKGTLHYWMHGGWQMTGRQLREAEDGRKNPEPPPAVVHPWRSEFIEVLERLKETIDGPWQIFVNGDSHLEATDRAGLAERRIYFPYGLIEKEPSFPLVNAGPEEFRAGIQRYDPAVYPCGLMVNAQTHYLQFPRTYLAAHYGRSGSCATDKFYDFPQDIIPGDGGGAVSYVLRHIEGREYADQLVQRDHALKLRELAKRPQPKGPFAGLIFNRPEQFLNDLADNLDIRADMLELHWAVLAGKDARPELRRFMADMRPYALRTGYNHSFQGPLTYGLTYPLMRLDVPELTAALNGQTVDPARGYIINLIDTIEAYTNGQVR